MRKDGKGELLQKRTQKIEIFSDKKFNDFLNKSMTNYCTNLILLVGEKKRFMFHSLRCSS